MPIEFPASVFVTRQIAGVPTDGCKSRQQNHSRAYYRHHNDHRTLKQTEISRGNRRRSPCALLGKTRPRENEQPKEDAGKPTNNRKLARLPKSKTGDLQQEAYQKRQQGAEQSTTNSNSGTTLSYSWSAPPPN